jgi:hypothetical protein
LHERRLCLPGGANELQRRLPESEDRSKQLWCMRECLPDLGQLHEWHLRLPDGDN